MMNILKNRVLYLFDTLNLINAIEISINRDFLFVVAAFEYAAVRNI